MQATNFMQDTFVEYLEAVRLLVTNPIEFFAHEKALPDIRTKVLFALPPIAVYAIAECLVHKNPFLGPLYLVAAYLEIGAWTLALMFVVRMFGEKRSFDETLFIGSAISFVYLIAWIPEVGPPLAALAAAAWTLLGLVHGFKMNSGAALTAVSLPVVVTGVVFVAISWLLVILSTMCQMFAE